MGIIIFVLAVVTVLLTSLFKNCEWSDKTKNLVAVIFSTIAAAGAVWVSKGGNFDGADLMQTSLLIYGAGQIVFKFILSGTAAEKTLADVGVVPAISSSKKGRHVK